jgi:hypothetical protein
MRDSERGICNSKDRNRNSEGWNRNSLNEFCGFREQIRGFRVEFYYFGIRLTISIVRTLTLQTLFNKSITCSL